jgi:hypothetical protein
MALVTSTKAMPPTGMARFFMVEAISRGGL